MLRNAILFGLAFAAASYAWSQQAPSEPALIASRLGLT